MYLADTSVLIELLIGTAKAQKVMEIVGDQNLATSSLCAFELLKNRTTREKNLAKDFLDSIDVIPFDLPLAHESAELVNKLKKSGHMINAIDILVATTANLNGFHLLTLDRDFSKIPGLQLTTL